jgi:TonB-dependent SusC/RagA subfamily outer membrane receptor
MRIRVVTIAIALPMFAACGGGPKRTANHSVSTGATSVMTAEDIKSSQPTRMEDLLARVPGIEVQRAGGDFTMRIRGGSRSSTSCGTGFSDQPLVVIDGMQVAAGRNSTVLGMMNPQDVARVEVLRDAGSTAMYGCAGLNGVVLISTKRR